MKESTYSIALTLVALAGVPVLAVAQGPLERLSVHGHLTQAFGMTERNQYLGIPERGTADYRSAALLFRYAATDDDHFVLQFSHERFGQSPVVADDADLEVDWVFYQRRFGDATSVRVGKVPLPAGIYNEIRDVGTLLPFYRPPNVVYLERAYSVETLNGVVVSHVFAQQSPWSVSVDGYFGNWEYLQYDGTEGSADHAVGGRVWLNAPWPTVRIGGGVQRFVASDIADAPPETEVGTFVWTISADVDLRRILARSELTEARFDDAGLLLRGYYGQLGLRITDKLTLLGQAEQSELRLEVPATQVSPAFVFDMDVDRDLAVGISYAFLPTLVVKAEHHWYRGYSTEDPAPDPFGPPMKTTYALFSVSVSY